MIQERADYTDGYDLLSMIYKEKGDLQKSFGFAYLSATETRTDSAKWMHCADLAIKLENFKFAMMSFNRAARALNPDTQYLEILQIKRQKIALYRQKNDNVSIRRTIEKQIQRFEQIKKDHAKGVLQPPAKDQTESELMHEVQDLGKEIE